MKQSKRILRIGVARLPDDSPDTSWIGEYSDTAGPFAIDRAHYEDCPLNHNQTDYTDTHVWNDAEGRCLKCDAADCSEPCPELECACHRAWDRRAFRYFNPGTVEPFDANATWIPVDVEDKREYWTAAMRKNAAMDYDRMESLNNGQWSFIGIRACADITINQTAQSIYSSGLWGIESDSEESYLNDVEQEELSELRATLHDLGFSKRAISTAIKQASNK